MVGIISSRYYMIGYVCGILVLVALRSERASSSSMVHLGYHDCWLCLCGLAVNPNAKTLKEKLKGSSEPKKPALEARFKILHSSSIKLNAAVLFAGFWLVWLSAAKTPFEIKSSEYRGFTTWSEASLH